MIFCISPIISNVQFPHDEATLLYDQKRIDSQMVMYSNLTELNGVIKLIPFYYFLLNPNNVINIFINYYKVTPKVFKDIFRIHKDGNKFIGMSYFFNIFNLSLFTYKYFDLLRIFSEYFLLKDNSKFTSERLKNIINNQL